MSNSASENSAASLQAVALLPHYIITEEYPMFQSSLSITIRQDDNDNTRSRNETNGTTVGAVQLSNAGVANTATFAIISTLTF